METITEGLTTEQYITMQNNNFAELSIIAGLESNTFTVLDDTMNGQDIVTAINENFVETVVSLGQKGSVFSSKISLRNSKYILDNNRVFNKGKLVFSFDDGRTSVYSDGLAAFVAKNTKGTFYINPDLVGTIGHPSWAQFKEMSDAGMDIQDHYYYHVDMRTLTESQILAGLTASDNAFILNGLPRPEHIAPPYYYSDATVKATIIASGLRKSMRVFGDVKPMFYDVDKYALSCTSMENMSAGDLVTLKSLMSDTNLKRKALILITHNIETGNTAEGIFITQLNAIIDYARQIDMDIVSVSELYDLLKV